MRVARVEEAIGALLLAVIAVAVIVALLDDGPDFDGLAASQDDRLIIFRIDVSGAYADGETSAGSNDWVEFTVAPAQVVTGDPAFVSSAAADPSFNHLEVHFVGRWPQSGGYPIVLNDEGTIVSSQGALAAGAEQLTRVSFRGDARSVGVMTFILGECVGESYLSTVASACEVGGE